LPLKVLHTGDLHLGMTFNSRGYPEALRRELVEARLKTLERLVETANAEGCQLFVVAGDLFHRTRVPRETVLQALRALSAFQGNCVAVLPGNHDYYEPYGGLWKELRESAGSFDHLLLLTETAPYALQDYGLEAVLYPAPCHSKHSAQNRLGWIRELAQRPPGRWHLGVAHGSVRGISPDFEGSYFPMEEEELIQAGLDHWFLGHTHVRYPDRDHARNCPFTYCGTPEPDGFDCRHRGQAWITTLDDSGAVECRGLTTGQFFFQELRVTVSSAGELEELKRQLAADGERSLVKLYLEGTLPEDEYRKRSDWFRELRESLAYLEEDDGELAMEITPATIESLFPRNSFPYLLLSRLSEKGEREALQLAYRLISEVRNS